MRNASLNKLWEHVVASVVLFVCSIDKHLDHPVMVHTNLTLPEA